MSHAFGDSEDDDQEEKPTEMSSSAPVTPAYGDMGHLSFGAADGFCKFTLSAIISLVVPKYICL